MPTPAPPRPLVPDDLKPSARSLPRAAYAAIVGAARNTSPADVCRRVFPHDRVALRLLTRAAVSGATTTTPAWAGVLVTRAVGEWLASLYPMSAAAALISRGITVSITEGMPIGVPTRASAPTAAPWAAEGAAIPMRLRSLSTADLSPRKLGIIVALSKELARYSGAQPIFEAMLTEEAALSLDAAYFSADDGSTAGHHAGLLAGVVAGAGSAVMANDLAKLAETVGAGGSGQVVFVMGPGRAAAAQLRMPAEASAQVLPSLAVPETRVIALDPGALVHGFGPDPEILASEEAVIHMSDTALDIASGAQGSGVLATPTQSMWQTGQIATRLLVDVAFCSRRSNAVAYIDGASW